MVGHIAGSARGLASREEGTAVIEFAFVSPVFLLLLAGIIQFGSLMFFQNNLTYVAHETVRRMLVGSITTSEQAMDYVESQVPGSYDGLIVSVTFPDPNDPSSVDYSVEVSAPMEEVALFNLFGILGDGSISAHAAMRRM